MNTPTPAQALGEVMALSEKVTLGPWEMPTGPCKVSDIFEAGDWNICPPLGEAGPVCIAAGKDNAAFIVALVNWACQHGQHFAGLSEDFSALSQEFSARMAELDRTRQAMKLYQERAEAAEARVREAEVILASLTHVTGQQADRIAAFLAAKG